MSSLPVDLAARTLTQHTHAYATCTARPPHVQVDLDAPLDEYGHSTLLLGAMHGRTRLVRLLLRLGADPRAQRPAHGGASAASTAAAHGHVEVLAALAEAGADVESRGSEGLSPLEYSLRRARAALEAVAEEEAAAEEAAAEEAAAEEAAAPQPEAAASVPPHGAPHEAAPHGAARQGGAPLALPAAVPRAPCRAAAAAAPPPVLTRLIAPDAAHAGAGSFMIDGGFDEAFLQRLLHIFGTLPLAPRVKSSQGLNDRAYLSDAEGWIAAGLRRAVLAAGARVRGGGGGEAWAPCEGEALPFMRFLLYAEAGGGLPPHLDLSRTDVHGRHSRCTFILYLTDCSAGGETVLLERLVQPSVLATVTPRRGRLLVFPHVCPHKAQPVVAHGLPKILLRGEML